MSGIYFRVSVCSQQLSPPFYKRKAFLHRLPGWDSNLVKRCRSHWIDDFTAVHRARLLVANVTKTTLDAHGCCVSPNLWQRKHVVEFAMSIHTTPSNPDTLLAHRLSWAQSEGGAISEFGCTFNAARQSRTSTSRRMFEKGLFRSDWVFSSAIPSRKFVLTTEELHLTGRLLSGSPIIRIGLALRVNLSRILQN